MSSPNADVIHYIVEHLSGESAAPLPGWAEEAQARAELEAILFGEETAHVNALIDIDADQANSETEAEGDL